MLEVGPVEMGVPIPPKRTIEPNDKLGLTKIPVGGSRLIKGITQERLASRAARATQNHGMKFTTRVMDGGVRIWRVE